MRYTTIIDISASAELYRSESVRLTYLHMCLICGYHDNDKGLLRHSLRHMAADIGITMSALRHAIKRLEGVGLVKRYRGKLYVRTWVEEQAITTPAKRARRKREEDQQTAARQEKERHQAELERNIEERKATAVTYEEYRQQRAMRDKQ